MKVYLAGPISGLSYGGCTEWREGVIRELAKEGIIGLSPMRSKNYLAAIETISADGHEYAHMGPLSKPRGVMTRDRFDTQRADIILMNLLGAKQVSIGTMIELGWADSARVPVVCAIEDEGNVHDHMMVTEGIGFRVNTLEAAVNVVKSILRPLDMYQAVGLPGAGIDASQIGLRKGVSAEEITAEDRARAAEWLRKAGR